MKLVAVFHSIKLMEAEVVRSRLEASDFHPVIELGVSSAGLEIYPSKTGGYVVQVPETESEEALELISATGEEPAK